MQAHERDIGEGLTEAEVMQLGEDVGIPSDYLQQALVEERTRANVPVERGFGVWLAGPLTASASRAVPGDVVGVEEALQHWMTAGELLSVKRRFRNGASWERQAGALVSLKRSLGVGGRRFMLSRAKEVTARIAQLGPSRCHVQLVADLSNSFREQLTGAGLFTGAGAVASGAALIIGVLPPFAVIPALLAVPLAVVIARSRRAEVERVRVALEQVLDRLERGEIKPPRRTERDAGSIIKLAAEEIRKALGP